MNNNVGSSSYTLHSWIKLRQNALFEALATKAQASGTLATVPNFSEKCHFTGRAKGVYDDGAKAMTGS
jgi:hypothetical protein